MKITENKTALGRRRFCSDVFDVMQNMVLNPRRGPLIAPCLTFSICKDKVNWPWLLEDERLNNLGLENKARTQQLGHKCRQPLSLPCDV